MKVGSLFSGIGGFDLGLERAGFKPAWFVESDPYCQRVLRKRWPNRPVFPDVCELTSEWASPVEVLCGGFPCQDLSVAGRGAGLGGDRSGLWAEYARIVGDLRPRYVIVENVSALLARGFERVLGDLAALGYDAEWDCIPASAVGAPHQRDRVWLVAYPNGDPLWDEPRRQDGEDGTGAAEPRDDGATGSLADADREGQSQSGRREQQVGGRAVDRGEAVANPAGTGRVQAGSGERHDPGGAGPFVRPLRAGEVTGEVADAEREGLEGLGPQPGQSALAEPRDGGSSESLRPYPDFERRDGRAWARGELDWSVEPQDGSWWSAEPDVGRVANGVPNRLDRVRVLGNALVPQIAEWIGRRILDYEQQRTVC